MALEVEVKYHIPKKELKGVRQRILDAGGEQVVPRTLERNIVYDNPWRGLNESKKVLRLRQDHKVRITYKGPLTQFRPSEAKVREEIEIEVDDFQSADIIIRKIGFEPRRMYEKYRETFHVAGTEVVLDELPFGNFVEIEAESEQSLREVSSLLGFAWEDRVLDSYLALLKLFNEHHNLKVRNLAFDSFTSVRGTISEALEARKKGM